MHASLNSLQELNIFLELICFHRGQYSLSPVYLYHKIRVCNFADYDFSLDDTEVLFFFYHINSNEIDKEHPSNTPKCYFGAMLNISLGGVVCNIDK